MELPGNMSPIESYPELVDLDHDMFLHVAECITTANKTAANKVKSSQVGRSRLSHGLWFPPGQ